MARPECVEIQCKSAINRTQGMPFKWSANPFSGCQHSCHYCYARAFYATAGYGNAGSDFETRLLVKMNFASVLRRELRRPSWRGESVAFGTATDCYQPVEGRYRLTRSSLEALLEALNPMSLVTKSPLVVRDVDILGELARYAEVRVFLTVTTMDADLARVLEPGTASPQKRLLALERLRSAGVPAGVLMCPVLPGLTDARASVEDVAKAAREHGAQFFGANPLRLMPLVKEHYYAFLEQSFPHLLPRYERAYHGVNATEAYQRALKDRIEGVRAAFGFQRDTFREQERPPVGGQLALL